MTFGPGRAPLLWILIPLAAGYGASHYLGHYSPLLLLSLSAILSATAFTLLFKTQHECLRLWRALLIIAVFCLAWGSYESRKPNTLDDWKNFPPREAVLELKIERFFDSKYREQNVSGIAKVIDAPLHLDDLIGQNIAFQIRAPSGHTIIRTSILKCRGELVHESMYMDDTTGYHEYLHTTGVFFQLKRGKLLKLKDSGLWFYKICNRLQHALRKSLEPPDDAPDAAKILPALILGRKSLLGRKQKEMFIATGTMHFFAISGLHIGILAGILYSGCQIIRLPTAIAAIAGLALLFLYVQTTGGSPSAVRAFIMVAFFWCANTVSRKPAPIAALSPPGRGRSRVAWSASTPWRRRSACGSAPLARSRGCSRSAPPTWRRVCW